MITLTILFLIWGIISYYRINKTCKEIGIDFNPFMGTIFDYFGLLIGIGVLVVSILIAIIWYLL